MKYRKLIKFILFTLIVFFFLQLISHIFLKMGLEKETPPRSRILKMSALVFPLDAEALYEYSFALLEEKAYLRETGWKGLDESIRDFKRAIRLNPLLYNAHFNLGKAYALDQSGESTLFDDSLKWLKRAAYIRGNRPHVSVELIKLMLSFWPFLENSDKEFCRQLLHKSIQNISRAEFLSIVEAWGRYAKDVNIFKKSLVKKAEYYRDLANQLMLLELDLKTRQDFLARYEVYYFQYLKNRLSDFLKKSTNLLKTYQSIYSELKNQIIGYYKIVHNNEFNVKLYRDFVKGIQLEILGLFFNKRDRGNLTERGTDIEKFLLACIKDFSLKKDLEDFYQFLNDQSFFNDAGLSEQYIELLIWNKMGDRDRVVEKGEEIRNSFTFIREEQKQDYLNILMLLVELYISENQFEKTEMVLEEAENIAAENEEVHWLRCKLNRRQESGERSQEIEEGKSENRNPKFETRTNDQNPNDQGKKLEENCERIKNSRIVDLKNTQFKKTVYLMDEPVIVITIGEAFKDKIKDKHLLQVFIDGWIYFEQYLGQIAETVKVEEAKWKKVEVEVRIQ